MTSDTTLSQSHTTAAATAAEPAKKDVFGEIFSELGDHHSFAFGPIHADLPIILYDNGLHVYSGKTSMKNAGLYTTDAKGHIVSVETQKPPQLDMSITNFVVFQWTAILLLLFVFRSVASKYKKNPNKAPSGLQNLAEVLITFVRDEVVRPNVHPQKTADRILPYFLSVFFFILTLNFMGLIPGGHTATSSFAVTGALAVTAFFVINYTAIREAGIGHWLHHLLGGAPVAMAFIMVPIEIIGLFARPFALAMRLFANMTAGHIIMFSLVGLIFFFETLLVSPISVAFLLFIYALESLVAFLQAYIFTMLAAVFVGLAIGEGHHDEAHAHGH